MKVKSESLVLQLRQHSSYLARAIVRSIVMLARAIFARAGDFARVWTLARAIARVSGHGLVHTHVCMHTYMQVVNSVVIQVQFHLLGEPQLMITSGPVGGMPPAGMPPAGMPPGYGMPPQQGYGYQPGYGM